MIRDSSVLSPELHRGKNVDADSWFPGRNADAAQAKRRNCRLLLKKKKKISKSSSTTGNSAAMFLVDMIFTQTPAYWNPKRFNLFRFLSGKVQFHFVQKKTTGNSIQMVNAPYKQ